MVAVILAVDDEFFQCLAVPGDTEDDVLLALVVAIAAFLHAASPAAFSCGYVFHGEPIKYRCESVR